MQNNNRSNSNIKSEMKSFFCIIMLALAIRIFLMELFFVPTGSMKQTIMEGDYLFATKYNYGYSIYSIPFNPDLFEGRIFAKQPERGDIIIMRPPHNMDERYIKRLIGLPGDKIQIINDVTYINDTAVERIKIGETTDESGQKFLKFKEILPNNVSFFSYKMQSDILDSPIDRSNYGPYFVENGHYFFMGDNRDNSGDSRYQLGTVPFRNLIAKAHFVYLSTKEFLWDSNAGFWEQISRVKIWLSSIRCDRFFKSLYKLDSFEDKNSDSSMNNEITENNLGEVKKDPYVNIQQTNQSPTLVNE